jgi:nitrite reductase/ring-hydroxylating ferredoxin subunit
VKNASQALCRSSDLVDSGDGVRFEVMTGTQAAAAFVVRYQGRVHAYLNRCAHVRAELDWVQGRFFDAEGSRLICSIHGAVYAPDTGQCVGGPCSGGRLIPVPLEERAGFVFLKDIDVKDGSNG